MTRRLSLVLIAATIAGAASVAPLRARGQGRDVSRPVTGSGSIAGTITTDETPARPLRRATVEIVAGVLSLPQSVMTDDAGRYIFRNLPAGNYTLIARRAGYVRAYYGSKKAIEPPGTPIAVVDGTPVTNIDLRLMRGGAIGGTVRYPSGQPAPNVDIGVNRVEIVNGQRRMTIGGLADMGGSIRTDDRGIYRAYGLAPGEYIVLLRSATAFADGSARRVTAEELAWTDRALAGSTASLPGTAGDLPAPPPAGQSVMLAAVYYPGTTRAADATTVTLGKSEERTGIDLTMELVPTARISGVVFDPDGTPMPQATVSLAASTIDQSDIASAILRRVGGRTDADGKFTLAGIAPGDYTINVRANPPGQKPQTPAGSPSVVDFAMLAMSAGGGSLWASDSVSVAGRDIDNVTLRLAKGLTISGKIVFESDTRPPGDASRVRLMLMPHRVGASIVDVASSMFSGMAMGGATSDGAFTINNVVPGTYVLNVLAPGLVAAPDLPGGDWTLKSAVVNGRDVADLPLDIKAGGDMTGVVLTLSDRLSTLSGTVIDAAGRPTAAYPIVVFSTNRDTWTMGSRRVQRARPATDGKYSLAGLPPGEYFVCAAVELSEERLYDPSFLEQLAAGGIIIKLSEGEKRTQDLKLGGGGL
ncbi:MAG TPA: carboxypeptidase regulatory-like domain-containing protein [Vicinamibacterales bacterium]|nr:carboxypeptidase regulatory-like domain-containing protein [Vicinamibacterales bacterium]